MLMTDHRYSGKTYSQKGLQDLFNDFLPSLRQNLLPVYRYVSLEKPGDSYILTVLRIPSVFEKAAGKTEVEQKFIGGNTTWRTFPDLKRVCTMLENTLTAIFEKAPGPAPDSSIGNRAA